MTRTYEREDVNEASSDLQRHIRIFTKTLGEYERKLDEANHLQHANPCEKTDAKVHNLMRIVHHYNLVIEHLEQAKQATNLLEAELARGSEER